MGFFNEDFYKELDKNYSGGEEYEEVYEDEEDTNDFDVDTTYYGDDIELEINKNNQEKFKDIMDNASLTYDSYWDLNNPVIRFILIVLGVIIAAGIFYYIIGWVSLF